MLTREQRPARVFEVCVHCRERSGCRPRGMCKVCYSLPWLRRLYPARAKIGYRGMGEQLTGREITTGPTRLMPGTEGKIRVLADRASRGEALFHPLDVSLSLV